MKGTAGRDRGIRSEASGGDAAVGEPSSHERRLEIVAVAILAVTALATAWSGYQASLWDGIQSSNYTQASAARTNAAQERTEANQFRIADLTIFENHVDALIDGDDELAEFYRQRFRDEFAVAYEAWIALDPLENTDAPASPLLMPEYRLAADQEPRTWRHEPTSCSPTVRMPTPTPTSTPSPRSSSPWCCSSPPSRSASRSSRCASASSPSPASG